MGEQVEMLEHHAYLLSDRPDVLPFLCDAGAVHPDLAAGGRLQKVDAAQQRGFTGTGRADDGNDLSPVYVKADVLQHFQRSEILI